MDDEIYKSLVDDTIRSSVRLDRYASGLRRQVLKLLEQAQKDIVEQIAKIDPTAPTMTAWKQARLENLNAQINGIINKTYHTIKTKTDSQLKKLSGMVAKEAVSQVNKAIGVDLFNVRLNSEFLKSIVDNTLIKGEVVGKWWNGQAKNVKQRLSRVLAEQVHNSNILQLGAIKGESVGELITAVRGVRAKGEWGAFGATRREAEALVRTSVMQVASQARQATYKANEDLIDGYEIIATLDARTTPLCESLDGMQYNTDWTPKGATKINIGGPPPYHFNCRTSFSILLKPLADIIAEEVPDARTQDEALAVLDTMPTKGSNVLLDAYTIADMRTVRYDLQAIESMGGWAEASIPTSYIPISDIAFSSSVIDKGAVEAILKKGLIKDIETGLPRVVYKDGKYVLVDGNKRVLAQDLLGKKYIKAKAYNIPEDLIIRSKPLQNLSKADIERLRGVSEKLAESAMRAAKEGPVSARMTYDQWLRTQPVDIQKEVLGVSRWKLWSEGKITSVVDLVDQKGRPLTLKELEALIEKGKIFPVPKTPILEDMGLTFKRQKNPDYPGEKAIFKGKDQIGLITYKVVGEVIEIPRIIISFGKQGKGYAKDVLRQLVYDNPSIKKFIFKSVVDSSESFFQGIGSTRIPNKKREWELLLSNFK